MLRYTFFWGSSFQELYFCNSSSLLLHLTFSLYFVMQGMCLMWSMHFQRLLIPWLSWLPASWPFRLVWDANLFQIFEHLKVWYLRGFILLNEILFHLCYELMIDDLVGCSRLKVSLRRLTRVVCTRASKPHFLIFATLYNRITLNYWASCLISMDVSQVFN